MNRVLQVVIGFAHDFAAGIWAATVLVVKHVVLLALFGGGTFWQWSLAFR